MGLAPWSLGLGPGMDILNIKKAGNIASQKKA
jgi:hypothetical protein